MALFREHEVVELCNDLPERGLKAGTQGAVVMVYSYDPDFYEIEFVDVNGDTLSLVTLSGDYLKAVATK